MFESLLPCAILVPTLNRPQRVADACENIHLATPEPHRIYWCASDPDSLRILADRGEWVLDDSDDPDKRYVTRMNKLVTHIGDAKTIFFGSDDVLHYPGWLTHALEVMATGPSVVVVNDMRNASGTQAVIRAEYLERAVFDAPGLAFHPGYRHNFADTEMFLTAHRQGEYARAMASIVEHFHPLFGGERSLPWDDTYRNASAGWDHDERLFVARAQEIEARYAHA